MTPAEALLEILEANSASRKLSKFKCQQLRSSSRGVYHPLRFELTYNLSALKQKLRDRIRAQGDAL